MLSHTDKKQRYFRSNNHHVPRDLVCDKILSSVLSGVRQANTKDMRLDVWGCVETYTIGMTPRA